MFTGLIQELAQIQKIDGSNQGVTLTLSRPESFVNLENGESIAVDGACLTLTEFSQNEMKFFVGSESLAKTTFSKLSNGSSVNLERSLALGDRLGGHMVSGHVEGTSPVIDARYEGECFWIKFKVSPEQFKFLIPKGSVCLNGVSLTINAVNRDEKTFEVLLIPETIRRSNLSKLKPGQLVNLECDQLVKIIAHQMSFLGGNSEQHP